jgi:HD-GYP domain-containing protein (c-di-GMP phosphodiesterase class II)
MATAGSNVLATAMAYADFLHDRLAICAPEVDVVRIDGPSSGEERRSFVSRRRHLGDGALEIHATIEATPSSGGRELSVPAVRGGVVAGAVTCVLSAGVEPNPVMERQLALYARATAAALDFDLPEGTWPSDLASDLDVLETRDARLGGHLERVAGYANIIVRALRGPLGLSDDFAEAVFWYAPFHDIGQVIMGDEVLRKPGRLDPDQWRLVQTHTTRGRQIIDAAIESAPDEWPSPEVIRNIVEFHHETLDGSGYPHGLNGEDVPLEARIISVADIFDALTSSRPYKLGWSANEALEEMDRLVLAGKLDPLCLTALVTHPDLVEAVAASEGEAGDVPVGHGP